MLIFLPHLEKFPKRGVIFLPRFRHRGPGRLPARTLPATGAAIESIDRIGYDEKHLKR
jgi:hypothetical protein